MMGRNGCWFVVIAATLLVTVPSADAQVLNPYVHYWILEQWQDAPGSPGDTLRDLNRPAISPNGDHVVFHAETYSTLDCLYRNEQLLAREGLPLYPGGPIVAFILRNSSDRVVRDNGDVLWECGLSTGIEALVLNDSLLFQAGSPLAAVPGLFHDLVSSANLLADGRILYGSVASDGHSRIIFDHQVVMLNSQSPIQTGVPIVGGPLDGMQWKPTEQFVFVRVNNSGDILFRGSIAGPGTSYFNERVWVLKRANSPDYELLFRKNHTSFQTNPTIQGSLAPPIGFVTRGHSLSISDNGDWAVHVELDLPSINFAAINEGIIVGMATVNSGAPTLLFQRMQMIHPQNAPSGWLSDITHVHFNGSGELLIVGRYHGRPAMFLYQPGLLGGTLTQLYDYPDPINADDRFSAIFSAVLADDGRIALEGVRQHFFTTIGNGIYRTEIPTVAPVEALTCQPLANSSIRLDWALPATATYTALEVRIDGAIHATLPGTDLTYTTPPLSQVGTLRATVVGLSGADTSPPRHCDSIVAPCSGPTDLTCLHQGNCGVNAGVTLSWTNHDSYSTLFFEREEVLSGQFLTIPVDPTLETFVDTTAVPSGLYEYRQYYRCTGTSVDIEAGLCGAFFSPGIVPPVTSIACGSSDFCTHEITISWSTQGLPYDSVTLFRNGVFLADVTQVTSYTEIVPPDPLNPTIEYELVATCNGQSGSIVCQPTPLFEEPSEFMAEPNHCDETIALSWTNHASYGVMMLRRDGVAVSPQPALGDSSYVDGPLPAGTYSYELSAGCLILSSMTVDATATLLPGQCGTFIRGDCNNHAEGTGTVNLADAVFMLSILFPTQGCTLDTDGVHDGSPECPFSSCVDACDANNDELFNVADVVFLLTTLFPPAGCIPDTNGIPVAGECPFLELPNGALGCGPDTDSAGTTLPPTNALDCEAFICP